MVVLHALHYVHYSAEADLATILETQKHQPGDAMPLEVELYRTVYVPGH